MYRRSLQLPALFFIYIKYTQYLVLPKFMVWYVLLVTTFLLRNIFSLGFLYVAGVKPPLGGGRRASETPAGGAVLQQNIIAAVRICLAGVVRCSDAVQYRIIRGLYCHAIPNHIRHVL